VEEEKAMSQDREGSAQDARGGARKRRVWPWLVGLGGALVLVGSLGLCVLVAYGLSWQQTATSWGGDAVGLIRIEGGIGLTTATGEGVVGEVVLDQIRQAEENERVKAIVVLINSPGGTVVPADEIYRALRGATKPVVAVMGDVAASGGYYIACGADKILAHPATITGSIGVYGRLLTAAELLNKLGIEGIIVRSGDSKAVGNIFEQPTEEQLAIEQAIVDELHELFVQAVAQGREMDVEVVRNLADGRPYTGQQALELGLIDALGGLEAAIQEAARLGGIDGEPEVIEYQQPPTLLELWTGIQQPPIWDGQALLTWLDKQYPVPQMRYVGP
jgi:protease-4